MEFERKISRRIRKDARIAPQVRGRVSAQAASFVDAVQIWQPKARGWTRPIAPPQDAFKDFYSKLKAPGVRLGQPGASSEVRNQRGLCSAVGRPSAEFVDHLVPRLHGWPNQRLNKQVPAASIDTMKPTQTERFARIDGKLGITKSARSEPASSPIRTLKDVRLCFNAFLRGLLHSHHGTFFAAKYIRQ